MNEKRFPKSYLKSVHDDYVLVSKRTLLANSYALAACAVQLSKFTEKSPEEIGAIVGNIGIIAARNISEYKLEEIVDDLINGPQKGLKLVYESLDESA